MFARVACRSVIAIVVATMCVSSAISQRRTWNDDTERFSVEAELVQVENDYVTLKRASGAEIRLPIARLSDADRQYLDALAQTQNAVRIVGQTVNLMRTAKYNASSTWDETTYSAAKAFDGVVNTRWNSRSGDAQGAWVAAQWDRPVTIRQTVVRQAFDRITGLKLQVLNDSGKTWKTVVVLDGKELTRQKKGQAGRGANDGGVNPILEMPLSPPVQTTGMRLLITSAVPMRQGTVSVFEFGAYGELAEGAPEDSPEVVQALANSEAPPSFRNGRQPTLAFPDAVTEPPSWNDANTPFDLAEFFKALQEEENAAPLYLDAFYEFDPQTMVDIVFPDMPIQEKEAWWPAARAISKEGWRLDEAWEKDPHSVADAEVDAWLPNYDLGFEKLAAAQERPTCVFQPGLSVTSLYPHIQVVRQVGRIVQWRTRRDLARGDMERPLQDLKMQLRLTRDMRARGVAIVQFVAIAVDDFAWNHVPATLNAPGIDVAYCDRLLALLAEHEAQAINAFREGNRADYIMSRQALHDLQHRTGGFDPTTMKESWGETGDMTSPLACIKVITDVGISDPLELAKAAARLQGALLPGAWQGGKMLSEEDYAKEVEALNRAFASILALAEQPNSWQDVMAKIEAAESPLNETTLARFVTPVAGGLLHGIRRGEALRRGTQCLVALRRWQLEHAEAPPDMETLVKAAGLPSVPMDPFSDQPLRMATVAGKAVIYSVGPDGQDDKAQVEWNLNTREPGDFLFRLETPLQ